MSKGKIIQSAKLYLQKEGEKEMRHVTNWPTFVKVCKDLELSTAWKDRTFLDDKDFPPKGKPITEWPEEENNNGNNGGHKTDRLYKVLYICPWYTDTTGFSGLDEMKEIGFNGYHTYSPYQWDQNGWWDTPEGMADCLRQVRRMLEELKRRDMYGVLQTPHKDGPLRAMAKLMGEFDCAIACTVEEPDCAPNPPGPSLAEQKRMYDSIKDVAPNVQVWGIFNGGDLGKNANMDAFDVITTDSYCYGKGQGSGFGPVPGTPAAQSGDQSLPWWKMNPWITEVKIPMMHRTLPKDMPVINIQQGFYNPSGSSCLPNIEEEWSLYHKEFGLNSFAVYAHGSGQGMDSVWVMDDNRPESYSIKNQCRALMKKLK